MGCIPEGHPPTDPRPRSPREKPPGSWSLRYGAKHQLHRIAEFPSGIIPPEHVRLYYRNDHYVLQWWDPAAKANLSDRVDGDLVAAITRARQIEEHSTAAAMPAWVAVGWVIASSSRCLSATSAAAPTPVRSAPSPCDVTPRRSPITWLSPSSQASPGRLLMQLVSTVTFSSPSPRSWPSTGRAERPPRHRARPMRGQAFVEDADSRDV